MRHSVQPALLHPGTVSRLPRLVIAGLAGDSGKTVVSLGLILAAKAAGVPVRAFKKGPDYIDAAWLAWASGHPARNLDTFLMGLERARASFAAHAVAGGLNIVEGNRGLYDGSDAQGTHSTAELAKTLDAPVVLVLSPSKVTRTAAALVLGCQKLDRAVRIRGVILNRVSGSRHERILREAIESACGIAVLGVLPRAKDDILLPSRHLGLVTPEEHRRLDDLNANLLKLVEGRLDLDKLVALARRAPRMGTLAEPEMDSSAGQGLKVGFLKDSAFTFYYPENLEALEAAGAELVSLSPLSVTFVPPDLDALYIGGGFPETHGATLSGNEAFLKSLKDAARRGLPIYAECGGIMLLSQAIVWAGRRYAMAGVFPFGVEICDIPQGHGYSRLSVDLPNPFFPLGSALIGHEFHYSRIILDRDAPPTACSVQRGTGCYQGRDGVVIGNTWASYTHLHALATPEWTVGFLNAARRFRRQKPRAGSNFTEKV